MSEKFGLVASLITVWIMAWKFGSSHQATRHDNYGVSSYNHRNRGHCYRRYTNSRMDQS